MSEETKEVFKRTKYNESNVARGASEEILREGAIVALRVEDPRYSIEPTRGQGPGEDMIQTCRLTVLDPSDESTPTRYNLFQWNLLPVVHPDYEDTHIPPSWCHGMWASFVEAFLSDKHPKKPSRKDGALWYNGKKIAPADLSEIELQRAATREETARELGASGGEELLRRTAYATIAYSSDKKTGELRVNATALRAELREGEVLTAKDALTVVVPIGASVEVAKTACKANGSRRAGGRPAAVRRERSAPPARRSPSAQRAVAKNDRPAPGRRNRRF